LLSFSLFIFYHHLLFAVDAAKLLYYFIFRNPFDTG